MESFAGLNLTYHNITFIRWNDEQGHIKVVSVPYLKMENFSISASLFIPLQSKVNIVRFKPSHLSLPLELVDFFIDVIALENVLLRLVRLVPS
jgi:hypothetical protein